MERSRCAAAWTWARPAIPARSSLDGRERRGRSPPTSCPRHSAPTCG
jgi:hypothetical protein